MPSTKILVPACLQWLKSRAVLLHKSTSLSEVQKAPIFSQGQPRMPTKEPPSDLPVHSFASSAEFKSFLEHSHETLPGFYLKLAKKSSGIPTITSADAVEIALCFGWIDGRANGLDDDWWTVRFTPRRAKSIWSQKNVKTVARLQEEGRMQPAGMAAVDAAKADGRWERAYAGPATITVPTDLTEALASKPPASAFFNSLNKTDRYSVLWRIETVSQQSRGKRINAIVQMLAADTLPGATTKPAMKTTARIAR
jgi:uncharacterized protein YdeI (YjbR/CyaY-like superfamily)